MKYSVIVLLAIILLVHCTKSDPPVRAVNCDGLITDTAGTNDNGRIYMPTAFTPNGDGLNDSLKPFKQNISSLDFTLYDANNTMVFNSSSGQSFAPTDTVGPIKYYYYKIQAITSNSRHIGECGVVLRLKCLPAGLTGSSLSFQDQLTPFGFTGATSDTLEICH